MTAKLRLMVGLTVLVMIVAAAAYLIIRNRPLADVGITPNISITPAITDQAIGDSVTANFVIDTGDKHISLVSVDVTYADTLEFTSFDPAGTAFDTTIKNPSPATNHFRIERARLDTGFQGQNGVIGKVIFKTKSTGPAFIRINQTDSQAIEYSADPQNILNSVGSSSFTITAPQSPAIISLNPSIGSTEGGTDLLITGSDFRPGALVALGDKDCLNPSVTSLAAIGCQTPDHEAGAVDVKVTNADGTTATLAKGFTYQAPPPPPETPPPANPTPEPPPATTSTSDTTTTNTNPTPAPATTPTPKPSPPVPVTKPVPVAAVQPTGIPSAGKSTLTVNNTCFLADSHDLAIIQLIVKDDQDTQLKDLSYKPKISVSSKAGLKGLIKQTPDGLWLIAIKSSQPTDIIVNIFSKGVFLGVENIKFANDCNATEATVATGAGGSATTTPTVAEPQPTTKVQSSRVTTIAGIIVGLVLLTIGGAYFWFKRKPTQ